MFKSQRRLNKLPKSEAKKIVRNTLEVEEVYNSKTKRVPTNFGNRYRTNRCTIIKPSYEDFGQFTEILQSPNTYKNAFREEFGMTPVIPETIEKLKELKKSMCQSDTKIEDSSSYGTARGKSKVNLIDNSSEEEAQWQNVENTRELRKFIPRKFVKSLPGRRGKIVSCREVKHVTSRDERFIPIEMKHITSVEDNIEPNKEEEIPIKEENAEPTKEVKISEEQNGEKEKEQPVIVKPKPLPTRVRIAEAPRIRVIAEKFSMFKKNNIELRRLEEKVVCLEYDVFDEDDEIKKPFQRMRAFFSIKLQNGKDGGNDIATLPPKVKEDFDVTEEDLNNLNKREIEIIDEHLPENRSLLEDLKKVLRRNQVLRHKKEGSIDLMYLYEIARRHYLPVLDELYLQNNVLTDDELDEIKEMILKKSVSSIHGVSRRKVKSMKQGDAKSDDCEISNSMVIELLRDVERDAVKV